MDTQNIQQFTPRNNASIAIFHFPPKKKYCNLVICKNRNMVKWLIMWTHPKSNREVLCTVPAFIPSNVTYP